MGAELATLNGHGGGVMVPTGRTQLMAEALQQQADERAVLMQYVTQHMVEGTDYGNIPGTKGNTLLKPGAEKLTELFRCTPVYEQTKCVEDWDRPLFHYEFTCKIVSRDTGGVVAHGVGSCNSREKKYRWRDGDRKCPECGAAAIMKSKFPPRDQPDAPPGWYCFAKKGGCGANFAADDQAITGQPLGRVENPDIGDCVNAILKIAKKRALVDAAIALARCSDLFTQDLDDTDHGHDHPPADTRPATRPAAKPQPAQQQRPPATNGTAPRPWTGTVPQLAAKLAAGSAPTTGQELHDRCRWVAEVLTRIHPSFPGLKDIEDAVIDGADLSDVGDWKWNDLTPEQVAAGWQAVAGYVAAEARAATAA